MGSAGNVSIRNQLKHTHVDNTQHTPSVLSFCPGLLGLERGFTRATGIEPRVVTYVEREAFIIENMVCAMEAGILGAAPIWSDAKTFNPNPFRGYVDAIFGGYPCQPFSIIGKQTGEDHPSHIWPNICHSTDVIRPVLCFFENVVNHLHIGYESVRRDLQRIGYTVKEGIYSALEVGATHRRERLYIMAVDNSQCERLEGFGWHVNRAPGRTPQGRPTGKTNVFPRERGVLQWEWEEPRFLDPKSGVGSSVNGYEFKEDIFRALGNSVVEQTAEVAFIDLLQKHIDNARR